MIYKVLCYKNSKRKDREQQKCVHEKQMHMPKSNGGGKKIFLIT